VIFYYIFFLEFPLKFHSEIFSPVLRKLHNFTLFFIKLWNFWTAEHTQLISHTVCMCVLIIARVIMSKFYSSSHKGLTESQKYGKTFINLQLYMIPHTVNALIER